MAREPEPREDLLREATALVERVEFSSPAFPESIVAGFRRDGSLSIYFGADPVYQFNAAGELRRAYLDGQMLKAIDGRLVRLIREETPEETRLIRRELAPGENAAAIEELARRLQCLAQALATGELVIHGQSPAEGDVLAKLRTWLDSHHMLTIAKRPNVG